MKRKYISFFLSLLSMALTAQTQVTISGQQVVQSGGYIVLTNADFVNHGSFTARAGEVVLSGDHPSNIQGTSPTRFHNLSIDKSDAQVSLGQAIHIANALHLTAGLLDIGDHELTIEPSGSIAEYSENEYIKTSGLGSLHQTVGAEAVDFPIGGESYKAVSIQNTGEMDVFNIRVEEKVQPDQSSGITQDQNAVDASWHIGEGVEGGSDARLSFRWDGGDELPGFDRRQCKVKQSNRGIHRSFAEDAAKGGEAYWRSQPSVTSFGTFTISSETRSGHPPIEMSSVGLAEPTFRIFPNPTTDYVIIENVQEERQGQLLSTHGQVVGEFQLSSTHQKLSLLNLPKGSYFLKIGTSVRPLVIQ